MATIIIKLKSQYKNAIKENQKLKGLVAHNSGTTTDTVDKWIRNNSNRLTNAVVTETIRKELKLSKSECLTEELDGE